MANPFYVAPPDLYKALQEYDQSYKTASDDYRQAQNDRILKEVGAEIAQGGITNSALGKLFSMSRSAGAPLGNVAAHLLTARMAGQGNFGTPIWGEGPDGKPVLLTIPKMGNNATPMGLPPGVTLTPGVGMADTGTGYVPYSKKSGRIVGGGEPAATPGGGPQFGGPDTQPVRIPQGMSPAQVSQRYRPGTPIILPDGRQGVVPGEAQTAQAPSGIGVIPKNNVQEATEKKLGSETGEKLAGLGKAKGALDASIEQFDRLETTANAIKNDPALGRVTGIVGVFPNYPGGKAANVQAKIDNLKAQMTVDVLQAMREASKTGGALGNVSNYEDRMLQQVIAASSQLQSQGNFKEAMDVIRKYAQDAKKRFRDAYEQDYGNLRK